VLGEINCLLNLTFMPYSALIPLKLEAESFITMIGVIGEYFCGVFHENGRMSNSVIDENY